MFIEHGNEFRGTITEVYKFDYGVEWLRMRHYQKKYIGKEYHYGGIIDEHAKLDIKNIRNERLGKLLK